MFVVFFGCNKISILNSPFRIINLTQHRKNNWKPIKWEKFPENIKFLEFDLGVKKIFRKKIYTDMCVFGFEFD